jgi:hypothetical protein
MRVTFSAECLTTKNARCVSGLRGNKIGFVPQVGQPIDRVINRMARSGTLGTVIDFQGIPNPSVPPQAMIRGLAWSDVRFQG